VVGEKDLQIHLQLFSVLRECLPPDAQRGRATVDLPAGTTLQGLVSHLGLDQRLGLAPDQELIDVDWQVMFNGKFQKDMDRVLQDGDQVSVFPPLAGG
jgi:molybdopterin converting factor small subunit